MYKFGKRIGSVILAGSIVFATATTAFAAQGEVTGGTLDFSNSTNEASLQKGTNQSTAESSIIFDGFGLINMDDITGLLSEQTKEEYFRIDDNRGTNAGWIVKVKASNLTTTVDDKTSTDPGAKVTVSIPISSILKVSSTTPTPTPIQGQGQGTELNVNGTTEVSVSNTGVKILKAESGYGAGSYTSNITYNLTISNHLPAETILTPTAENSAFKNVPNKTEIGIFAGTYETTITYGVSQEPTDEFTF